MKRVALLSAITLLAANHSFAQNAQDVPPAAPPSPTTPVPTTPPAQVAPNTGTVPGTGTVVRRVYPGLRRMPNGYTAVTNVAVPGAATTNAVAPITDAGAATNRAVATTNAPAVRGPQTNVAATGARRATNAVVYAHLNVTPAQLQNINRLAIDLNTVELVSRGVPVQQPSTLVQTLQAAPIGNVNPSAESITQLAQTLTAVMPSLNLTAAQRRQLATDLNMAFNSGRLSDVEAQRVVADARGLLQGSSLTNPGGANQLFTQINGIVSQVRSQTAAAQNNTSEQGSVGQSGTSQAGQGQGQSQPNLAPAPVEQPAPAR